MLHAKVARLWQGCRNQELQHYSHVELELVCRDCTDTAISARALQSQKHPVVWKVYQTLLDCTSQPSVCYLISVIQMTQVLSMPKIFQRVADSFASCAFQYGNQCLCQSCYTIHVRQDSIYLSPVLQDWTFARQCAVSKYSSEQSSSICSLHSLAKVNSCKIIRLQDKQLEKHWETILQILQNCISKFLLKIQNLFSCVTMKKKSHSIYSLTLILSLIHSILILKGQFSSDFAINNCTTEPLHLLPKITQLFWILKSIHGGIISLKQSTGLTALNLTSSFLPLLFTLQVPYLY